MIDRSVLKGLGVHDIESLRAASVEIQARPFLVEGLLYSGSVNLAAGDSGIGKTALLAQLGLSVAAGKPWLGRNTQQGPVLYIDGESPMPSFLQMIQSLSEHLRLPEPPADFFIFSPIWDTRDEHQRRDIVKDIEAQVQRIRPALIIIDPMRSVSSTAESGTEETMKLIKPLRNLARDYGAASLILHHRRKTSSLFQVNLENDPYAWMETVAGARALVNHTDARIGIDRSSKSDLVVGGFARLLGPFEPIQVERQFTTDGDPSGYNALRQESLLDEKSRTALESLPQTFRHRDAYVALGGTSGSTTNIFLAKAQAAQLIRAEGSGRNRRYHKMTDSGLHGSTLELAA